MRKLGYGHIVLLALFFLGCDESLRSESRSYSKSSRSTADSQMNSVEADSVKPQALNLKLGDTEITGSIESYGTVTIDYPTELRGKIKVISFKDKSFDNLPFLNEHCKEVEAMVKHGVGFIARSGYKSTLKFSLPAQVASSLPILIMEHVKSLGHMNSRVKNPVEPALAKIKIFFSDDSLSLANGRIGDLEMALNVGTRGDEVDILYKHLQLKAGDIVCDLATKKARMEMHYPINGEKKIIKVVFDSQDFFPGNKAS